MFVIYIKALTKVVIVKFIYAKIVLKIILLCKLPILPNALINRFTVLWQILASERHGQNWSGSSMQLIHCKSHVSHPDESIISFLPIIDLTDYYMTCIFFKLM